MIIFRYLAKQVLVTMLAVTFILLLVFMSGRFIKYLAKAASGGLSPDVLFSIMAYRLPGFLELILPLGLFIGILLAYGRMYLESEMTVLHACGMSQKKLLAYSLSIAFAVFLLVGFMSLYLSPYGMQKVGDIFDQQAKMTEFEMLSPGRFQSLKSSGRVTYTESLSEDKKIMNQVFISQRREDDAALEILIADSGYQKINQDTEERFLILENGHRYQGSPGQANYNLVEFDTYAVRISEPDPEKRRVEDEAIPTSELFYRTDLDSRSQLQWRASIPFLVPVVTLIAVALCRVNPRQGRYFHLFPAMLAYVLYLGLLIVVRKKIGKGEFPEYPGLWAVHGLFFVVAICLLSKEKIKQQVSSLISRKASHAQN